MSTLAEQVALTTGGVTPTVGRMVVGGYVERVPCPTDRRVVFATLTAQGEAKLAEATEVHARNLARVFSGFDAGDLRHLDDMLDRLREARVGDREAW